MKVALIGYFHGYGGAEKQLILLANALAKKRFEVYLIALASYNYCYKINDDVRIVEVTENRGKKLFTRYIGLLKALKQIKPDVSINFWFQSAYFETSMRRRYTGKIIYSERGDPGDEEYSGLLGIIRSCVLPHIDGFAFQTKAAQSYFDKNTVKRSIVIPNPVNVSISEPSNPRSEKKIVSIGRLHPQKNQELLIDAFNIVHDVFPDYTLEIFGDGELKEELQKKICKLDLCENVFLMGSHKDVHDLIKNASVFVLSSDFEGLPNALIEAMLIGLPCVSTDCKPGGARDIISEGENGFIVPRRDVEALANAIIRLINDKELARMFSQNAKKIQQLYDSEVIFDKWDMFIRDIVGTKTGFKG